jgi:hypothetical protein
MFINVIVDVHTVLFALQCQQLRVRSSELSRAQLARAHEPREPECLSAKEPKSPSAQVTETP